MWREIMSNKFSATDWKNAIEKDIVEMKKAIYDLYGFINMFEQWRRLPFNKEAQDANQNNNNTKGSKPRKAKRKSSKKLHRQAGKQNQRA